MRSWQTGWAHGLTGLVGLALALSACLLPVQAAPAPLPEPLAARFAQAVRILDLPGEQRHDMREARDALQAILSARPDYAPAHREMARYFIQSDRNGEGFAAAEGALQQALRLDSRHADAYVLRGHLYRLTDRLAEARVALGLAERFGSQSPWLHVNWGRLLMDEDKPAEAAPRFQKALDGDGSNRSALSAAYDGLIHAKGKLGRYEEVDALYRRKLAFAPESAWVHGNYAKFLMCRQGRTEEAIQQARVALAIMNYGAARYWLAAALYNQGASRMLAGRAAEAHAPWSEAKQLHPDERGLSRNEAECQGLKPLRDFIARVDASRPSPTYRDTPQPRI